MRSRNRSRAVAALALCVALGTGGLSAQSSRPLTPEQRTAGRFESLRSSPPRMLAFLLRMPKGADLHTHLSGAVYAESYIRWAASLGLCVDPGTFVLSSSPCATPPGGRRPASDAL